MKELHKRWKNLSQNRKISLAAVVSLLLASLLYFFVTHSDGDYTLLFRGLNIEDANQVVDILKEKSISYQLQNNGTAILVEQDKVHELRLELAGQGLPKSRGVGFEIFDTNSFGITEFVQKVNYNRALEGELSRTISSLMQVNSATIHIARPKPSIFNRERKKVKASVVLEIQSGEYLGRQQIQGICYLIANAVEGLRPEDVTILDQNSHVLYGSEMEEQMPTRYVEKQKWMSKYLQHEAQSMLDTILGKGRSIVKVNVEIDFTKVKEVQEIYNPENQIIASETTNTTTTKESYPVGSTSSRSKVQRNSGTRRFKERQQQQEERTTSYAVDKTVKEIEQPAETLKRLSVALVVDVSLKEQQEQLGKLVKESVGYNEKRGDSIEVNALPFQQNVVKEKPAVPFWQEKFPLIYAMVKNLVMLAIVAILAYLVYFILVGEKRREILNKQKEEKAKIEAEKREQENKRKIQEEMQAKINQIQDKVIEKTSTQLLLEQVQRNFEEDPKTSASILKKWLRE
ncbi:flagellar basal-body MS-ring/collar protein FliF [Candidatus Uabimicrobium amorphum]|uniref:Flagellar M-ring protein n=1 Tax=Uabimicrobium amorphum TaxID=2596890 RepID=A0A5S9INY7_UABAM|nr:flagellar basal-body MS-ring/collar protein FliF [Candidatus Uabimicrobium amorphum]BBM85017.1 flagellar M-ring protein [Candidatus Uabimicrobium amorphum]